MSNENINFTMANISYHTEGSDAHNTSVSGTMKVAVVLEDLVMIFGILGNIALFALMRRHKFSQHSFAVYFSFSAVFDSWYLFSNALVDSLRAFQYMDMDRLAARHGMCGLSFVLQNLTIILCPWLVLLLTVDRFVSICHPDFGRRYSTKAKAIGVCILATMTGLVVIITYAVFEQTRITKAMNETGLLECRATMPHQEASEVMASMLMFIFPLFVILILSGRMLCVLKRTGGYAFISEEGLSLMNEKAKLERMNGIVLYVLIISFLTWLPLCTVEMIYIPYQTFSTIPQALAVSLDKAWHVTLLIYMAAYAQNFYILMLMSRMFRMEFVKMMRSVIFRSSGQDPDPGPVEEVVLAD